MGAVESPCASSDIIAWKRLDNCDVCKGDTKDRLAAARAGFEALSGVEASSGLSALNPALTSQQRRVIENAIEHWCMTLSTGNGLHLLVDGCERLVRLNPNPLALVVEDHGTFPLACMERVEIPSAAWPNSECLISFTATSAFGKCSLAGGEGASLRFTFSRREECMEFALSLRSLQVLTPDLHGQFHTADGGDSSRTSASSARSHGSISLRGSGRSGNVGRRRKRQTSKQRGKNCSPSRGAGPFTKSSLGVQPLLSSAELRKIVQQEDDAPKPSDSPSGRKMKPGFVLESLRSASTASLERSREVRSPPPIRNSPLHLLGGAASELRGDSDLFARLCSHCRWHRRYAWKHAPRSRGSSSCGGLRASCGFCTGC
eukprot:TRINITY_DN25534_c0_g2_i1.p1 TRINITY_DN25534_c0_g2~~TRINITY_DN25534_c0_g2_i1.p1  ORF type:complete len:374 (-),score=42.70 TRINITY_DN25534_c0_g2_i1:183-1304(-)